MSRPKKLKFDLTKVDIRLLELMEEMKHLARRDDKDDFDQSSP